MNSSKLIWILILGSLFISLKMGQAAKAKVQQSYQIQESQLEKAMMDLE